MVCALVIGAFAAHESAAQEANQEGELAGDIDMQESGLIGESIGASEGLESSVSSAISAEAEKDIGYVRKKPAEPQFFAPSKTPQGEPAVAPQGQQGAAPAPQPTLDASLESIEKDIEKLDEERSELGQ